MRYSFTLVIEGNITTDSSTKKTTGSIVVKAKCLSGTHSIKLKDFNHARVIDDSTNVNRAIARTQDGTSQSEYWIIQSKDGSEEILEKSQAIALMVNSSLNWFPHYPPRYETFVDDDYASACSKAQDELEKNRYRGTVELNIDNALGKDLRNATIWSYGKIYGYNSADDSTAKVLPMMWIKEGSDGSMSCCFGRLDDYFYM